MMFAGMVNKAGKKNPNKQGAMQILQNFTEEEKAGPWFKVTMAVLRALSMTDVSAFWMLARRAPYVLQCVLFHHCGQMWKAGYEYAATVFSECGMVLKQSEVAV